MLYPLKFNPILKDKIWGGKKLRTNLNKKGASDICGESWEISDVENESSVITNGFLAGNNLNEIVEIYMGDLVGDKVYDEYGNQFPLLIKFIEAKDNLSIQVHPDDAMAEEKHGGRGKTEMWYVLEAEEKSNLIVGFNQDVDEKKYITHLNNNTLTEILNFENVKPGDVFFLPAGRIHAICKGLLLAEIQQTSDITYRIFDWNRVDDKGVARELHTEMALKAMDFTFHKEYKTKYKAELNKSSEVVTCKYFTTNILELNKTVEKDYIELDSFVIYICLEGTLQVAPADGEVVEVAKGESILIPATIKNLELLPNGNAKLLEVYIK